MPSPQADTSALEREIDELVYALYGLGLMRWRLWRGEFKKFMKMITHYNTLIIVGNGFDLAHQLESKFSDFLNFLWEEAINDPSKHPQFFNAQHMSIVSTNRKSNPSINTMAGNNIGLGCKNKFIRRLYEELKTTENWCDVEQIYYDLLLECKEDDKAKGLNEELHEFKCAFLQYLGKLKAEPITTFTRFFNKMLERQIKVACFNYTTTLSDYLPDDTNVHYLHGNINMDPEDVVLGYSGWGQKYDQIRYEGSKKRMKNIKQQFYSLTSDYKEIINFVKSNNYCKIYIIGHSLGLSDQYALNEIFSNSNVTEIRVFPHDGKKSYRDLYENFSRIISNPETMHKFVEYTRCFPLHKDTPDSNFTKDLERNLSTLQ